MNTLSLTPTEKDLDTLSRQLGRPVRDVVEIGARCVCGNPLVATTAPRLSNGIPFPTTFYLTHPVATAAVSRLENAGVMTEMTQRLENDPELAAAYRAAHENYLAERDRVGTVAGVGAVPEIDGITAGGMPDRVKCLHVLAGHSLAVGPGINPLGDETLQRISGDFDQDVCRCAGAWDASGDAPQQDRSRHTRRLAGKSNPIQQAPTQGPVAAIDCGTNSIRLLIAQRTDDGLKDIVREHRITRLGEGVDETGEFSAAALERTFAAVDDFAELIAEHDAGAVRFVATSASRDVSNREEFVAGIRSRLNITPEIISGDEEAQLTFAGAASVVPASTEAQRVAVVDLGGGSTEVVYGTVADGTATLNSAVSINAGCVRYHERFLHTDPPTAAETEAAHETFDADFAPISVDNVDVLIGVAGTITTLAAASLELEKYEPGSVHGARIPIGKISAVAPELLSMTSAERAELGYMQPARADVIGAGALLWQDILHRFEAAGVTHWVASEKDILDGIALSIR